MGRREATLWTALLSSAAGWGTPAAGQHPSGEIRPLEPFEVDYFVDSRTVDLTADADRVFEMFTPEGRRRWSSFDPLLLYRPREGWQGAVYLQATLHEGNPNTAVVADFEPENRRIRYITVIPHSEAWEMDITVSPRGEGSRATVVYRVTPLSPEANVEVREFFEGHFAAAIGQWAEAIDRALERR